MKITTKIINIIILCLLLLFFSINFSSNLNNGEAPKKNKIHKKYANKTVIFCFHDIGGKGIYSITKKEFETIVKILYKKKIKVISLYNWWNSNIKESNHHSVIFTFDDGYYSILKTAVPILEKYNFGATFFIYLDRYSDGSSFYKTLSKLDSSFEIGSHSFTHNNLIDTYQTNKEDFFKEIFLSKKKLEYLIQKDVHSFAWPYGLYKDFMLELAKNAGYTIQVSSYGRTIYKKETILGRYTITSKKPIKQFKKILWKTLKITI